MPWPVPLGLAGTPAWDGPAMMTRTPGGINEVDVDFNMKGIPFRLDQPHHDIWKHPYAGSFRDRRDGRPAASRASSPGFSPAGEGDGGSGDIGPLYRVSPRSKTGYRQPF